MLNEVNTTGLDGIGVAPGKGKDVVGILHGPQIPDGSAKTNRRWGKVVEKQANTTPDITQLWTT